MQWPRSFWYHRAPVFSFPASEMLPAAKLLNHCWFKWQLLLLFKTLGEFLSCNFFGGSMSSSFYLISENSQTHTIWNQIWWTPELDEYHLAVDLVSCLTPSWFLKNSKEEPRAKVKSCGTTTPEDPKNRTHWLHHTHSPPNSQPHSKHILRKCVPIKFLWL